MMLEIQEIEEGCKHVILCEGRDELLFLVYYLNSRELKQVDKEYSESVQVFDFGGIGQLASFVKAFSNMNHFSEIESILIVRDAEKSVNSAIGSIGSALKKSGMPVPSSAGAWESDENGSKRVAYLLFPSLSKTSKEGTLEDLCIDIIKDEHKSIEVLSECDSAMNNLLAKGVREFPRPFKTKMHSFFALTDLFVGMKIGEAAKAGAFNWASEKLEGLKQLLKETFDMSKKS